MIYKDCSNRVAALAENAKPEGLLALVKEIGHVRHMLLGNANTRLLLERLCLRVQDTFVGREGGF
jgi:hypothetical protein